MSCRYDYILNDYQGNIRAVVSQDGAWNLKRQAVDIYVDGECIASLVYKFNPNNDGYNW